MSARIDVADCIAWAEAYDGPPFHALLCDPPYELGFMGRAWDRSGISFNPDTWRALARVLHPGAFGMAFASSRGWHRLAVAIEDAGLIIHPSIFGWAFGSGFPKATRIDTQIDKAAGAVREVVGVGPYNAKRPASRRVEDGGEAVDWHYGDGQSITTPATELAAAWAGHRYGLQALKPALEPIIVFQKPYAGRPVDSITATGAGALNVDGGRVPTGGEDRAARYGGLPPRGGGGVVGYGGEQEAVWDAPAGRWPANLVVCHSDYPVMRLCATIDRGTDDAIRGHFNGYTRVSELRTHFQRSAVASQPGAEVLRAGLPERGGQGQAPAGAATGQDDASMPTVRPGLRGLDVLGQAGASEVLLVGLQGGVSGDADRRAKSSNGRAPHPGSEGQDCGGGDGPNGSVERALAGRAEQHGTRVCQCGAGLTGAGVAGDCCADGEQERVRPRASRGNGAGLGPRAATDGTCPSCERRQDGQPAGQPDGDGLVESQPGASSDRTQDGATDRRQPPLDVLACDVPAEWRHHFELTDENLGCVRVGERRVATGTTYEQPAGTVEGRGIYGPRSLGRVTGYADADGLETVAAYACAPGCPVAALGAQSGELKPRANRGPSTSKVDDFGFTTPHACGIECNHADTGTAARFYHNPDFALDIAERLAAAEPVRYVAKASRRERNAGCDDFAERAMNWSSGEQSPGTFQSDGTNRAARNPHPTVKPLALAQHLATLLLPPDAYAPRRLFVPFAGSGSECIGAMLAGWDEVVGVELSDEYADIARARLAWWEAQQPDATQPALPLAALA